MRLSSASAAEVAQSGRRAARPAGTIAFAALIVAAEVAISIVLICGSVLLFKSLMRLQQVDTGVRAPNVVTASIDIAQRHVSDAARRPIGFYDRVVEQIKAIPGVESAALAGDVPLEGTGGENLRTPATGDQRLTVRFKRADAGYFDTHRSRDRQGARLHARGSTRHCRTSR